MLSKQYLLVNIDEVIPGLGIYRRVMELMKKEFQCMIPHIYASPDIPCLYYYYEQWLSTAWSGPAIPGGKEDSKQGKPA